jgi:hypothetical protein
MSEHEHRLAHRLRAAGYEVLVNGWPDLLVQKDGKTFAYEVKAKGDNVRPHQKAMHDALRAAGIEVEIVDEHANLWLGKS